MEEAVLSFDFSLLPNGVATVVALHLIDVEADEPNAGVQFFDPFANLIGILVLPQTGDNGVAQVLFGPVPGVATMEVHLNGSGAIDNLIFSTDGEGCTPGFWKTHLDAWAPTGYTPAQSVSSVFAAAAGFPALGASTLHEALSFAGGPGPEGAAMILLRAAVAALLNAAHPGVTDYPMTEAEVIDAVNAALASNNRATMLALATTLDEANNLGCPIDD